eukprot:COSAG01_NODE_1060_length_11890_cov_17.763973_15_plen_111_part_00
MIALILSLHDSFSSSKGKLSPPASFTHPHARRPPFSMGMIACPSLVARLLGQREGDVPVAPAALTATLPGAVATSSEDLREGAACRSSLTEAQLLGVRPRGGVCAAGLAR